MIKGSLIETSRLRLLLLNPESLPAPGGFAYPDGWSFDFLQIGDAVGCWMIIQKGKKDVIGYCKVFIKLEEHLPGGFMQELSLCYKVYPPWNNFGFGGETVRAINREFSGRAGEGSILISTGYEAR